MNPIRTIRRLAAALAGLTGALLALAAAAPAAFAMPPSTHGWSRRPPLPPAHVHQFMHIPIPVRTVLIGGMPGWQITLIAAGAALLAVLLDRARMARKPPPLGGGHNQSSATFLQRFCDRPDATFSLRRSAARATGPVGRSTACKGEKCAN
jgi:hypothetical protein